MATDSSETSSLLLHGLKVFKTEENYYKWLSLPNKSLGGIEPTALLKEPGGISKIHDVLGRIEHGVYS